MNKEKILVSRDDAAINTHQQALGNMLPRYQQLVRLYLDLKLDKHSKSIPDIIKNAYTECRMQVQRGLPPALKDTDAVETILLNGEKEFFSLLTEMRKAGELVYQDSFRLTGFDKVDINQASLDQFVEQHSIWLTDLRGKELLEKVVDALNEFQKYSVKTYSPGADLVLAATNGGICLNGKWHLCDRDKQGNLNLNMKILALFESNRK